MIAFAIPTKHTHTYWIKYQNYSYCFDILCNYFGVLFNYFLFLINFPPPECLRIIRPFRLLEMILLLSAAPFRIIFLYTTQAFVFCFFLNFEFFLWLFWHNTVMFDFISVMTFHVFMFISILLLFFLWYLDFLLFVLKSATSQQSSWGALCYEIKSLQ